MKITVTVHSDKWKAKADEYKDAMRAVTGDASEEAAHLVGRLARTFLATFSHPPMTKTPSPPGAPPAMISGRLAASIKVERDGDTARVGPTAEASSKNGPYGRIQELGGTMTAHSAFGMRWKEDGVWHRAMEVRLPKRPYLKLATDLAKGTGMITEIYRHRWADRQHEVLG